MADPTPVVKLPNAEYIELVNPSYLLINLKNWKIEISGRPKISPDKALVTNGFVLLVGAGEQALFSGFGSSLEVSGLSLPNDGFIMKLFSPDDLLIDSLNYSP